MESIFHKASRCRAALTRLNLRSMRRDRAADPRLPSQPIFSLPSSLPLSIFLFLSLSSSFVPSVTFFRRQNRGNAYEHESENHVSQCCSRFRECRALPFIINRASQIRMTELIGLTRMAPSGFYVIFQHIDVPLCVRFAIWAN